VVVACKVQLSFSGSASCLLCSGALNTGVKERVARQARESIPTGTQLNPGKMKQVVRRQYGSIDIDLARGEMAAVTTIDRLIKELWKSYKSDSTS
jgi:hypothetical protein